MLNPPSDMASDLGENRSYSIVFVVVSATDVCLNVRGLPICALRYKIEVCNRITVGGQEQPRLTLARQYLIKYW